MVHYSISLLSSYPSQFTFSSSRSMRKKNKVLAELQPTGVGDADGEPASIGGDESATTACTPQSISLYFPENAFSWPASLLSPSARALFLVSSSKFKDVSGVATWRLAGTAPSRTNSGGGDACTVTKSRSPSPLARKSAFEHAPDPDVCSAMAIIFLRAVAFLWARFADVARRNEIHGAV